MERSRFLGAAPSPRATVSPISCLDFRTFTRNSLLRHSTRVPRMAAFRAGQLARTTQYHHQLRTPLGLHHSLGGEGSSDHYVRSRCRVDDIPRSSSRLLGARGSLAERFTHSSSHRAVAIG